MASASPFSAQEDQREQPGGAASARTPARGAGAGAGAGPALKCAAAQRTGAWPALPVGRGPGLDRYQRQLFSSAGGTSRGRSNTGLGLTFCKLAAEAHGGSIVVESEAGQGTRFTVVLPLVPADLPAPG